ncbi:MAG: anti-sigma factor family protein [Anaerolineales bacterium]
MTTNRHVNDENLIGYVYRTLGDAEREVIDAHLVSCQVCRARLTAHETRQRQIDLEMRATINGVSPPRQMTFSAIAPRLQRRRFLDRLRPQLALAAPVAAAFAGLFLSLSGLWQVVVPFLGASASRSSGALPTLACFCFMFVSVEQFDRAFVIRSRFLVAAMLTFILWLGTAIIGLLNILIIRDLVLAGYVAVGGSDTGASIATIMVMIISVLVYITVVIGGAEYHYKRIDQPSSWKFFTWTIIIQLLIMILPYFVF